MADGGHTHDAGAEQSLLGGLMLFPEKMADFADSLAPDDFGALRHARVYEAMLAVFATGDAVEVVLIADALRQRGWLEDCGGIAYLYSLDSTVPATGNLGRYADLVRRSAFRRRARDKAKRLLELAADESLSADALAEQVEAETVALLSNRETTDRTVSLGESIGRVYRQLEAAYEAHLEGRITGVPTGFRDLDALTCGLQNGDLVIVAGRPSMGKTAFALQMAKHVATQANRPAVVFSLEMDSDSLTRRVLSSEARVDGNRLRSGALTGSDWPKLAGASERIHKAPLLLNDSPAPSVLDVRARCRRLRMKHGPLSMVMVDYIGLVKAASSRGKTREQEVAEVSKGLKSLARELNCPVVALSQLNRDCEKRPDKRPMLSDLRESGGIEQDADVICLLFRDEYYQREASKDPGVAEVIVAKQRNGAVGTVRLAFRADFTRFDDLEERHEQR